MRSSDTSPSTTAASAGLLAKERTLAGPAFNRWLIPPAALCIHLCIGLAYGFSVFWLPMSKLVATPDAACVNLGFIAALTTTTCNWTVPQVTHVFETFIAMLGLSAALWGGWLEHAGPRKAGLIAAACWGGGLLLGGVGVQRHQLWLVYLGCGVLGGIGQGIGYITPVSTLIKWFPDRRGMATGFAIMGYGGGAMIGAPLAVALMTHYAAATPEALAGDAASATAPGVAATLMTMGVLYFLVMAFGAFAFRVAPSGWRPLGWSGPAKKIDAMITRRHVHLERAWKTPQFWLIWAALCVNVTAGIAVISMASPMFQDVFGAKLLGNADAAPADATQKAAILAAAAGLVGLISLFNSGGRIFWASLSDKLGRKTTYSVFFVLGIVLYGSLPTLGHMGLAAMFVAAVCVILTLYGGGFATLPAYLADLFGTQMVGAIHGRVLTAWSVAGVAGPWVIAALREAQLEAGVAKSLVYDRTLYVMAGLLAVGLVCNLLIRPLRDSVFMSDGELAQERSLQHEERSVAAAESAARGAFGFVGVAFWTGIGAPFLIGVAIALRQAAKLFG